MLPYLILLLGVVLFFYLAEKVLHLYLLFFYEPKNRRLTPEERQARWGIE